MRETVERVRGSVRMTKFNEGKPVPEEMCEKMVEPFVGTKKVTVTLKKGTYTFQCDPHAQSGMKGTFKVS